LATVKLPERSAAIGTDRLIAVLCGVQVTVARFAWGPFGAALAVRWIGPVRVDGLQFALNTVSVSLPRIDPHPPDRRTIERCNDRPCRRLAEARSGWR
jgi:hypothetical protein